ncbi:type VII secretion protein EssB/YukC [Paenibacillus sp. NPDC056579]|uniref:type VII secretion protein EssB/YukC n=1 Tax=Paenibacillus sp. NPDC056579 TaxID=3345871 RepID=UPI00367E4775
MAKHFDFNGGTLIITKDVVKYRLPKKVTLAESPEQLADLKELPGDFLFPLKTVEFEDDSRQDFIFYYSIEDGFNPFEKTRTNKLDSKLHIVDSLIRLGEYTEELYRTKGITILLEPVNIYIDSLNRTKALFAGIDTILPSSGFHDDDLLEQVKRLILMLFSSVPYAAMKSKGIGAAREKPAPGAQEFLMTILRCKSFDDLRLAAAQQRDRMDLVEKEIAAMKKEQIHTGLREYRKWIWMGASLLLVVLAGLMLVVYTSGYNSGKDAAHAAVLAGASPEPAPIVQEDVLKALRLGAGAKYKDAILLFQKIDPKQLTDEDKYAYAIALLKRGAGLMALDVFPDKEIIDLVVQDFVDKKNNLAIKQIKVDAPVVKFEKAVIDGNTKAIVELHKGLELDKRRSRIVAEAYMKENNLDEAGTYALKSGDDKLVAKVRFEKAVAAKDPKKIIEQKDLFTLKPADEAQVAIAYADLGDTANGWTHAEKSGDVKAMIYVKKAIVGELYVNTALSYQQRDAQIEKLRVEIEALEAKLPK